MKKMLVILVLVGNSLPAHDYDVARKAVPDTQQHFKNFQPIATQRLILRKLEPSDAHDVHAIVSDPEVVKMTAALELVNSLQETRDLVKTMCARYEQDLPTRWAVVDKATQKVIGLCGFVAYSPVFARAEIGYALARSVWNKGLITEVSKAVTDFAFTSMKVNRLEATVDPDNNGSIRVIEKLGMKYEGRLRQHIICNEQFRDRLMYSILRSEWAQLKS